MAMTGLKRLFGSIMTGGALLGAGLLLSGCISTMPLEELEYATPVGTAFDTALYKNYAFLAHSFGDIGAATKSPYDLSGSLNLTETGSDVADLANLYASKAMTAARGEPLDPENAHDADSHDMRDRLLRALGPGRDAFARDAARAQVDYDCWLLNATVPSQSAAAVQCLTSLQVTLPRLEAEVKIAPPVQEAAPQKAPQPQAEAAPAPAAPPVGAQPPVPAQASETKAAPAPTAVANAANTFTVYFDFNSWTLTAENLKVLEQAVANARGGGNSKIVVVGHTDTSGSAGYNKHLSLKRANVVKEALVDLGAKRKSIVTKGVGERDLAVETGDNVNEPKNRRSVITLQL